MFSQHRSGTSLQRISLRNHSDHDVETLTLENYGVCLEIEEYHAPGKRNENSGKKHDRLEHEHCERTGECLGEGKSRIGLQLLRSNIPIGSSLLSQFSGMFLKQSRRECFYNKRN